MKRVIILFAALLLGAPLFAQEGLFVEDLFEGRVISPKIMKKTVINGSRLEPYKLDTYKSLSFEVAEAAFHKVEILIIKDSNAAEDKQMEYVGDHLTYAVISLPKTYTGLNRFLCFQAREERGVWTVTVVYLRGTASVEDLESMFNKRKK